MLIHPIRPEPDFLKVLELVNSFEPEPLSLTALQQWFQRKLPGRILRATVATNAQDQVVGYCEVFHEAWFPAGEFQVWVIVDPKARKQGIGLALYNEAQAFMVEQEACCLKSEVRDNRPEDLHFAQKLGFVIERCQFESTLDLIVFDEQPFLPEVVPLVSAGIQIASLADFGDSQAARRKLYEVNYATALDIPGVKGWMSFTEFETAICGADWYRPEGQLAAFDREAFIGISAVKLVPQT